MDLRPIDIAPGIAVPSVWAVPAGNAGAPPPCVILAPGAGANMKHPFISFIHEALCRRGIMAVKFDFPYAAAGRKPPDPPQRLLDTWRSVLACVRAESAAARIFVGGKSMGGRIASLLVADGGQADGLVLLGYPLQPAGRPHILRAAHLARIRCPALFVQGTRDPLCDLDRLRPVLGAMPGAVTLEIIEGADHAFKVPRRMGKTEHAVWEEIAGLLAGWLASIAPGNPP